MKVFVQILLAVALAASAGCSGGHGSAQSVGSAASGTGGSGPLLALVGQGFTSDLQWLHPRSLTRIQGRRTLAMGERDVPWAFSPDRSAVAIGSGRVDSVEIVNLTRMAAIRTLQTGFPAAVAWPTTGRVLLVETSVGGPVTFRVFAPNSGKTLVRGVIAAHAQLGGAARTPWGLVLLLTPEDRIGPSVLVGVDAHGRTHRVALNQILTGYVPPPDPNAKHPIVHSQAAGVAADASGSHAFVVSPSGLVAAVDLATWNVSYHQPRQDTSLLSTIENWLQPPAYADGALEDGAARQAVFLSNGLIAITGTNTHTTITNKRADQTTTVAGLTLIDPRTWAQRKLDPATAFVSTTLTDMIAYDSRSDSSRRPNLAIYTLDGNRVTQMRTAASSITTSARYAYLGLDDEYHAHRVQVIDLSTMATRTVTAPGWVMPLTTTSPQVCWC